MGLYHLDEIYTLKYFKDCDVFYDILELNSEKLIKSRTIVLTNINFLIFDLMPNNNLRLIEQFDFCEIVSVYKRKKHLDTSNSIILFFRKKKEKKNDIVFLTDNKFDKFYEILMDKMESNKVELKIFSSIEFPEETLKILSEDKFSSKSIFFIYYLENLLEKKQNYNVLDLLLNMYRKVK